MSVVLPNLDFVTTPAVVGVRTLYDFSTIVQTGVNPLEIQKYGQPKLQFLNESPVGMQIQLAQSLKSYNIAAGAWGSLDIDADDKGFYWTPQYILLPNPAVNLMLLTYLPPGDPGTNINVLGNSPIQGVAVITNTTAQFLEGISQILPLTELDTVSGNPMLLPANGAGIALVLGARDAGNNPIEIVDVGTSVGNEFTVARGDGSGNLGAIHADDLYLSGQVVNIDGIFTVGKFGVSAVVADSGNVNITTTGLHQITSFVAPVTGSPSLVRVSFTARLLNGTTPQLYTAEIFYADAITNTGRTQLLPLTQLSGVVIIASGANNFACGAPGNFVTASLPLNIFSGSNISVQFNDPLNTPNDTVRAVIEILA